MNDKECQDLYNQVTAAALPPKWIRKFYLHFNARATGMRREEDINPIITKFKRWMHLDKIQNGFDRRKED